VKKNTILIIIMSILYIQLTECAATEKSNQAIDMVRQDVDCIIMLTIDGAARAMGCDIVTGFMELAVWKYFYSF